MENHKFNRFSWQTSRSVLHQANRWDWAALPIILGFIFLLGFGASQMISPYQIGTPLKISLDPWHLPYYLLRTTLRMMLALVLSLLFSFVFAALAAHYRLAEKIMLPALDILQSIPVLGFLTITITGFIALFPGSLFGVECAAIFAIFTSQAWNMAFSMYQSIRAVPLELREAACIFHLSPWQRFWRMELPFATPSLLWNMMVSMSGGWFFVVACETITVANYQIQLPGMGSYIAYAISQEHYVAMLWAMAAMLSAILIYDQLLFRPLIAWASKFKYEEMGGQDFRESWFLTLLRRTRVLKKMTERVIKYAGYGLLFFKRNYDGTSIMARVKKKNPFFERLSDAIIMGLMMLACWEIGRYIQTQVGWMEVWYVCQLGVLTFIRVTVMIILASLIWVPIGVYIGLHPRYAQRLQPIVQMMAAFPANFVFPLVVIILVKFHLNPDIWLTPLMVFGTQWYILFNVIAGASVISNDLLSVADNVGLSGWMRWKRFLLPAIFPYFVTGAITASGGSWNASIVAEYVSWGDHTLIATGLGSYIAQVTAKGDFPRVALGIAVMCFFVIACNRLIWRKLYKIAEEKMRA